MKRETERHDDAIIDLGAVRAETKGPPTPQEFDTVGGLPGGAGLADD